jgi:hypothetical protein
VSLNPEARPKTALPKSRAGSHSDGTIPRLGN